MRTDRALRLAGRTRRIHERPWIGGRHRRVGNCVARACEQFFVVVVTACGAPLTLYPLLTLENLGMKNYGTLYGIFVIMAGLGGGIGPLIPGIVHDNINTYLPVFYVSVALMLIGAIIAASIKSPAARETPAS